MRAGDNASAPAHAGPLNYRARLVPQSSASSPSMMVASDPPNGVPRHRPGPAHPVHRSFNAEKCRYEGCSTMLQSGMFCKQHVQFSGGADINGVRNPTRNVPIVPSQPRSASFNVMHTFQRQDAPPHTGSSPSNSKKLLPERMMARKSGSTMPLLPAPTESSSLYASNSSQSNDSRPQKRQRASGSYEIPTPLQGGQPRFSSEHQGHFEGGRSRPAHASPLLPKLNNLPGRPQSAVHQHPNGLHSPVTTGASPSASPAWGSPLLQSRQPQHEPRNSPPGARPPVSAWPSNGHPGPSKGAKLPPSQRATDQRGMERVQQPPISREYRLESNGAASPDPSRDKSAVALYEKHRRDNMSHAELKARMQDAKLCPNPQGSAPELMVATSFGPHDDRSRDRGTADTTANVRHEQQPPRAAPARSSNWRPSVPSMSSFHGWPHRSAAIDLTRSSSSPIEIPGSRPQSSGNTQPSLSQAKATVNTAAPSPNISTRTIELEVQPGTDAGLAALQESNASPRPALITSELQKAAVDPTNTLSRPTSRQDKTPTKLKNTTRHQGLAEKVKPGELLHQAGASRESTATPINLSQLPLKTESGRRQRILRQLEAAKRAEDALRRGVALMPSKATTGSPDDNSHLHKGKVNGVLPNSTTSSDSGIALLSPTTTEGSRLKVVPEPERRRLELAKEHDPAKLDGYIYGELNEPCRPISRLFGMLLEERPPQKTRPAQNFAYIDPRVHWAKPRSSQWHDDMRTKLQARGNRKKYLGKAAARQTQRKRDGALVAMTRVLPVEPPERVAANPEWLAALKILDDIAAKHRVDEKARAGSGEVGETGSQISGSTLEADMALVNGDIASNRRSGRHNSRQSNGLKSADTTPRRVLRTNNSFRPLNATVEDAEESEADDDKHSAYGASGGRKTDGDRMVVDTTPTRKRR